MTTNIIDLLNLDKSKYGRIDDRDRYHGIYLYIVQIGTGGNGGPVIQSLAQMLGTTKTPHTYVVCDPDEIERKNLMNQLFLESEIGLKKADVFAERYASVYDVNMFSYSDKYIETVKDLVQLFNQEYMEGYDSSLLLCPIIIGCVDNHFSRTIMHEAFNIMDNVVYIDAGNESIVVPEDWRERPKTLWTEKELYDYHNTGWSGQIVCGVKMNGQYQPPLAVVSPEVLEEQDNLRKPSELSCSELAASDPQRVIVNKFAALAVTNYLNEIIDTATISNHITKFHAKDCYMRSYDYIPDDESL